MIVQSSLHRLPPSCVPVRPPVGLFPSLYVSTAASCAARLRLLYNSPLLHSTLFWLA